MFDKLRNGPADQRVSVNPLNFYVLLSASSNDTSSQAEPGFKKERSCISLFYLANIIPVDTTIMANSIAML